MDTVQFWEERDYYPFSPSLHSSSINEYLNGSHVPLKIIERKPEKVEVACLELDKKYVM